MNLIDENGQPGFDFETAKKSADVYSNSTGLQCIIIDKHGETLYVSGNKEIYDFCCKVSGTPGSGICKNAHLYGSYQAERFGGKYIFFCPMGLVHWVSPIMNGSTLKGAVVGGPVQMMEPDEFLLEESLQKNGFKTNELSEVMEHIKDIPIISTEAVNSLAEMLFILAAYISDMKPSLFMSGFNENQPDISDYLNYLNTMGGDEESLYSYPIQKEKELLSLISIGDKSGSQKLINELFGHIFFSSGGNFDIIKARVLELIILLSRAALSGGADIEQIFGLNYNYIKDIQGFKSVDELAEWLKLIMSRFTDLVFDLTNVKHVDVIYKAIDYIKQNFTRKLSLEEVASKVFLSPSYFSKIFNEEMKLSYNAYLNQLRIEMSKNLLLDNSLSLIDISSRVGFEDQSYFSKVFKKITGVSPGKYRESKGQALK